MWFFNITIIEYKYLYICYNKQCYEMKRIKPFKAKISWVGNSLGVRIPMWILKYEELEEGQEVEVHLGAVVSLGQGFYGFGGISSVFEA